MACVYIATFPLSLNCDKSFLSRDGCMLYFDLSHTLAVLSLPPPHSFTVLTPMSTCLPTFTRIVRLSPPRVFGWCMHGAIVYPICTCIASISLSFVFWWPFPLRHFSYQHNLPVWIANLPVYSVCICVHLSYVNSPFISSESTIPNRALKSNLGVLNCRGTSEV